MNQMLPGIDNREPKNPYIMEKSFKSFLMSFFLGTISINFGTTLCSMSYPKCEIIVQTRKSLFIYTQNFCWPLGTQVPRVFFYLIFIQLANVCWVCWNGLLWPVPRKVIQKLGRTKESQKINEYQYR